MSIYRLFFKVSLVTIFFAFTLLIELSAQDIKYKTILKAIDKGESSKADSLLRIFLSDTLNENHTNAHLQLAILSKNRFDSLPIFSSVENIESLAEFTLNHFRRSKELIDERELRKNSKLYKGFEKRDIRSGKNSITVFDIQLLIDNHIDNVQSSLDRYHSVHDTEKELGSRYTELIVQYKNLMRPYTSIEQFWMRAGLGTIASLNSISNDYQNIVSIIDPYIRDLNKLADDELWTFVENTINEPIKEGYTNSDFSNKPISVWDYELFSINASQTIKERVFPIKSSIISYDKFLESLVSRSNNNEYLDTVFIDSAFRVFNEESLKYLDPDPLPLYLFSIKKDEIQHDRYKLRLKLESRSKTPEEQLRMAQDQKKSADFLKRQVLKLSTLDLNEEYLNYLDYVDQRYGGFTGLNNYIEERLRYAENEIGEAVALIDSLKRRNSYMEIDGKEVPIDTSTYNDSSPYLPLLVTDELSVGRMKVKSFAEFYIIPVNKNRSGRNMYQFPADSIVQIGKTQVLAGVSDKSEDIWALFFSKSTSHSKAVVRTYPCQVVRITEEGRVLVRMIDVPGIPESFQYTYDNSLILNIRWSNGMKNFVEISPELQLLGFEKD